MKRLFYAIAIFSLLSCGQKPKRMTSYGVAANSEPKVDKDVPGTVMMPPKGESTELELIGLAGSQMRMINAQGLTRLYRHVFPEEKYGFQHCAKKGYLVYEFCHDSIFNSDERILMGSFDLFIAGTAVPNVTLADSLTLNYMRSLRAGLGRECKFLVARELDNLKQGQAAQNKLIKASQPKAGDLEEFFRTILGIQGSKIPVDIGVDTYVQGFAKATPGGTDEEISAAYQALCVAIAMDPEIILY